VQQPVLARPDPAGARKQETTSSAPAALVKPLYFRRDIAGERMARVATESDGALDVKWKIKLKEKADPCFPPVPNTAL
jgi:hypothetical protein